MRRPLRGVALLISGLLCVVIGITMAATQGSAQATGSKQPTAMKTITGWAHAGPAPTDLKTITGWVRAPHRIRKPPVPPSAHPELDARKTKCLQVGESATACLDVYWHATGGVGIDINHVYLRTSGGFWEVKATDCNNVRMWNDNDVVQWRKDDAECDIYRDPGYRVYTPSQEMPFTSTATVGYTFTPKLDSEPDGGERHISITVGN